MKRYVILYRTGGWAACKWLRLIGEAPLSEAKEKVADLTKRGYKAFYRPAEEHESLGMPVGWHWKLVDYRIDHVYVDAHTSTHAIPQSRWERARQVMIKEGIWA